MMARSSYVVVFVIGLLFPLPAPAQKGKPTRAVVQEIDAVVGTITLIIELSPKDRRIRTFNLARPDLPVTSAAGAPLRLTDVVPLQRIFFDRDGEDVTAIRLTPPTLFGTLISVHPADRTLKLSTKLGDKTIQVPLAAKIYDQTDIVPFADLKAGEVARVGFADDHKTVVEVRSGKGVIPLVPLYKHTGVLIDLDPERGVAQIYSKGIRGDQFPLREVSLSKDSTFALMHESRHFRDLARKEIKGGVKVQYWTDNTTRKTVHMEVDMPILANRKIKSVDSNARLMVLEDPDGDKTLTIHSRIRVVRGGGPGDLADLRGGIAVTCGLGADHKSVEWVQTTK